MPDSIQLLSATSRHATPKRVHAFGPNEQIIRQHRGRNHSEFSGAMLISFYSRQANAARCAGTGKLRARHRPQKRLRSSEHPRKE